MRKAFLGIICAICVVCHLRAEVYDHTFRFSESDFSISPSAGDSLVIVSLASPAVYNGETQPGIPFLPRSLAIPQGYSVHDYSVSFKKRLIRSGVDLRNAARPIPTNAPAEEMWAFPGGYAPKVYPDTNCVNSTSYQIGGVTVAGFIVSPFIFDAAERNLYFIDSLTVSIDLDASTMRKAPAMIRPNQLEMLDAVVENREILGQIPVLTAESDDVEYIDYIIITSNALKSSFQPLADWKCKKGVRTKIVTVEEIDQNYTESTQQMRIKACIKDYWTNNYTQYVLLGGDVEIVPAQYCYCEAGSGINERKDNIPADVYYSALEDLDWDTNKDGKFGEISVDKFNYVPYISVTRAPARNATDVNTFVTRTIDYEQNPQFTRDFLQSGTTLDFVHGPTAESLGDMLFNAVINQKVYLGANKLYDTYTYNGEKFIGRLFKTELQKGYQFAEVISHGQPKGWTFDDNVLWFNAQSASEFENSGHTLLTTIACETNAFDQNEKYRADPCLSEGFFRNPKSGIIGYLGSSREGWHINTLDLSMAYEVDFYKRLLYNDGSIRPLEKNFGLLVNLMKHSLMSLTEIDPYSTDPNRNKFVEEYRWLHLSINALGDPETPIYNTVPRENLSASISQSPLGNLQVNTGIDDARVCVSSSDGGDFYEIQTGKDLIFKTGAGEFDVWVTKQNYRPKHFKYTGSDPVVVPPGTIVTLPSQITSVSPSPASTQTTVGFICYNLNPSIQIVFTNINGSPAYTYNVNRPITSNLNEVTLDISHFQNGTYIVSLIENGKTIPSTTRFIKQ